MQLMRFIKGLCIVIIILINIIVILHFVNIINFIQNVTSSEPKGIYLTIKYVPIEKKQIRQICLGSDKDKYLNIMQKCGLIKSKTGCPNGYLPILKTIVGVPNDVIEINKKGVLINNQLLVNSKAVESYNNEHLMPISVGYVHRLESDEYWSYGSGLSKNSYDSRYFGIVKESEISNLAILIKKDHQ